MAVPWDRLRAAQKAVLKARHWADQLEPKKAGLRVDLKERSLAASWVESTAHWRAAPWDRLRSELRAAWMARCWAVKMGNWTADWTAAWMGD